MTEQEFHDRLARLETDGVDLTETLRGPCKEALLAGVDEHFSRQSDGGGKAWPKRKDPKPQHALLELTGSLRRAATDTSGSTVLDDLDENTLTLRLVQGSTGTSRAGIRRHEFGDRAVMGRDGILARPFFGISDDAADSVADAIADAVAEAIL